MKEKSVLFVINNFNIGGPQKSLLSLLYKLDYKIYNVSLVILNEEGSLIKYLPKEVSRIPTQSIIKYAILSPENFIRETIKILFSSNYKLALRAIKSVVKGILKKNMVQEKQHFWKKSKSELPRLDGEFDVAIGVSGGSSMMYIADCVSASKKISWIRTDYRVLKRDNEIDRNYFEKMSGIISVSHNCKDIFLEIFPETHSKVEVMYNVLPFSMYEKIPADTSIMSAKNKELRLLTICRLDPNKGLDMALDALKILLEKQYNVKWYVLGDGDFRRELEQQIKTRKLEKKFVLLGFHFNTAEFIKKADIIVHPSRFEGKSNVIDEAKNLLKPVIATRYETVNEQITDERNGLIAEMNSESIAEKIEKLVMNENLKSQIHENLMKDQYDDTESVIAFQKILEK